MISCNTRESNEEIIDTLHEVKIETAEGEINENSHSSKEVLDWQGIYRGTLPCSDCNGIFITLEINKNNTYKITLESIGKSTKEESTGNFDWDKSGKIITIKDSHIGTQSYLVGENKIWVLDEDKKVIEGDLAESYILTKNIYSPSNP